MRILTKYIIRQVVIMVLVVGIALTGLDFFFNLVHELQVVGRANYTLSHALSYLCLVTPGRFYMMFPWAALIGSLISLGHLAKNSELVVMRSVGISVNTVALITMKAAILMMCVVVLIGEGLAPSADRLAYARKAFYLSAGQSIETAMGIWIRQGEEFIHIHSIQADGQLQGITRYLFNTHNQLQETIFAETGLPLDKGWELKNIRGTRFLESSTESYSQKTQWFPYVIEPEIIENSLVKHPERLSLLALWKVIDSRQRNALSTQTYLLAFWNKLAQPLVIMLMVFLAVPFVFGPLRSVSIGSKIVTGILVAFSFHTLNHMFVPLAIVYHIPAWLAVLTPLVLFSGIGVWMIRRI